jgi:hypothetical protein
MKQRGALVAGCMLAEFAVLVGVAAGHQSPAGCTSNGLDVSLSRDRAVARVGTGVTYTVRVANSAAGACDVTDARVRVVLPAADGTPTGQTVTLADNVAFAAGAPARLLGPAPYAVAVDDGVTSAVAAAAVEGVLHDGPTDSGFTVSRTVAIAITRPHLTLRMTAIPDRGSAPLDVQYRYELVNDSATPVPMVGPSVIDGRCGALQSTGGDTTNPGLLDVGETWLFTCSTRFDAAGIYENTAVASAGSTVDGRSVTAGPVSRQVVVSAAPATSTSVSGAVTGTVPATLALSLGPSASFGTFAPGVAADYFASAAGTVTSTAGAATLTVADPATSTTGHLVNGADVMPQALQVAAGGGAFAPIGGLALPTELLSYSGPVSNDRITIRFKQPVAAGDALRTGTYAKTLTFTLTTSQP